MPEVHCIPAVRATLLGRFPEAPKLIDQEKWETAEVAPKTVKFIDILKFFVNVHPSHCTLFYCNEFRLIPEIWLRVHKILRTMALNGGAIK